MRVAVPFLFCSALQSDATKATASLCDAVQVWGRVTRSGFPAFSFSFSALSALSAIRGGSLHAEVHRIDFDLSLTRFWLMAFVWSIVLKATGRSAFPNPSMT